MSPHQNFCWFAMFILLTVTTALPSNLTQENTNSSIFGRYQTMSNREQAYVSGGSLISFDDKLLAQEKSDILDSMLYAELTAGDVYNRNNNFVSWYKLYMEVLQETGWQIAGISLAQYKAPPHTYFTLLKVVWDLLAPLCQAVQREVRCCLVGEDRVDTVTALKLIINFTIFIIIACFPNSFRLILCLPCKSIIGMCLNL